MGGEREVQEGGDTGIHIADSLRCIIYLFVYLFWLYRILVAACGLFSCSLWALSCGMHVGSISPTRDRTWATCIGSVESYPLDHQGSPWQYFVFAINLLATAQKNKSIYFIFLKCWIFVSQKS